MTTSKHRRAVRVVNKDDLRAQLITVRGFHEKSDLCMIGRNLFCADCVIEEVCS